MAAIDWDKAKSLQDVHDERKHTSSHDIAAQRAAVDARSVYVGNLPYHVSTDAIKQHFKQAGEVRNVHLPLVKSRMHGADKPSNQGYCFLEFNRYVPRLPKL